MARAVVSWRCGRALRCASVPFNRRRLGRSWGVAGNWPVSSGEVRRVIVDDHGEGPCGTGHGFGGSHPGFAPRPLAHRSLPARLPRCRLGGRWAALADVNQGTLVGTLFPWALT